MKNELAEKNPYAGFINHHLRIGDSYLHVPPTSINVSYSSEVLASHTMRSKSISPKKSNYIRKVVTLDIYMIGEDYLRVKARDLVRQIKLIPFLPVENRYLNEIHRIEGLAIRNANVKTVPGFPNAIQLIVEAEAFDPFTYITTASDESFEDIIDWDLYRWYYRRGIEQFDKSLQKHFGGYKDKKNTDQYINDLFIHSANEYSFSIVDEESLKVMRDIVGNKKSLMNDLQKKHQEKGFTSRKTIKDLETAIDKAEKVIASAEAHGLNYDEVHFPGLNLVSMDMNYSNMITPLQLQKGESPTFQYLGSNSSNVFLQFESVDEEVVGALVRTFERVKYLSREYREYAPSGGLRFSTPLTNLFGINNVILRDLNIYTSSKEVGLYYIDVDLVAYSAEQEREADIAWLSSWKKTEIDPSLQGNLLQDFTRLLKAPTQSAEILLSLGGVGKFSDTALGSLMQSNSYTRSKLYQDVLKGKKTDWGTTISKSLLERVKYESNVEDSFEMIELYPDLELPTFEEVAAAGFKIKNPGKQLFVDPDFYYKTKNQVLLSHTLKKAMQNSDSFNTTFRDFEGGTIHGTSYAPAVARNTNSGSVSAQSVKKMNSGEFIHRKENNIDFKDEEVRVDKKTGREISSMSKRDAYALIYERASNSNIPPELALAVATRFDKDLHQFYFNGVNVEHDGVYSNDDSSPKYLNKDLTYSRYEPTDGGYVGTMNIPLEYLNGDHIKYSQYRNIEEGVNFLSSIYSKLHSEREIELALKGIESNSDEIEKLLEVGIISEEHDLVKEDLDLDFKAMAYYFGLENEYQELLDGNLKRTDASFKMLKSLMDHHIDVYIAFPEPELTDEVQDFINASTIKRKSETFASGGVPIPDIKTSQSKIDQQKAQERSNAIYKEEQARNKKNQSLVESVQGIEDLGNMHDLFMYDQRGSIVRAFPTFLMVFIDEGQYVGAIKMADHFFHYKMIEEITFTRNRKDAASTGEILLNNFTNSLDDHEKIAKPMLYGFEELWNRIFEPGFTAKQTARSRDKFDEYYKSIYLTTGTRVHLRMGYGSSARRLPTIMNGPIQTIENDDEHMLIRIIDDGHELANKLKAKPDDYSDAGILYAKQEPTQLVDEILTDKKGVFGQLLDLSAAKDESKHSHGIVHFGETASTDGFKRILTAAGAAAISPGALVFSGALSKDSRPKAEVNMNIYETTGLDREEHNKLWSKIGDSLGFGPADEDGIRINLFDKTTWDVLNITAAIGHDHHVAVHPFGFRNTVFSGKLHFPIAYGYKMDKDQVKVKTKSFRQLRFYDSYTTIISNTIKASAEDIKTVASGYYMDNGKMKNTPYLYADKSIYAERQKLVNIDTTLHAKGAWLLDKIPIAGKMINKPIKWKQDQGVAMKIAVSALRDHMKNMYGGYLTVLGDPSAKPYDLMWLDDSFLNMKGPAEIEEITHIMSIDSGFITVIKPDLVVVSRDTTVINEVMKLSQVATAITFQFIALVVARHFGKHTHTPILNAIWALTKKGGVRAGKAMRVDKAAQWGKKKVNMKTLEKWDGTSKLDEVNKAMGTNMSKSELKKALQSGKLSMSQSAKASSVLAPGIITRAKDIGKSATSSVFSMTGNFLKGDLVKGAFNKVNKMKAGRYLTRDIKAAWKVGRIARMATLPGWISLAVEALVVGTTSTFINELFERKAMQNKALIMVPLKRGGGYFTAGIDGHAGSVVGDNPGFMNKMMSEGFAGKVLNFAFGVDTTLWGTPPGYDTVLEYSTNKSKTQQKPLTIQSFYQMHRPEPFTPRSDESKLFAKDAEKALKTKKEITEKEVKRASLWEYSVKKFNETKDKIAGWFKGVFDKFKSMVEDAKNSLIDMFSSDKDGSSGPCTEDMNGPPVGKAVGLSKYFEYLNPKLESEAKRQGVLAYLEVIKAITMRESGGNYIKRPDVMQASESKGWKPNTIKSVDLSIKYGIEHFKKSLEKSNYDLMTLLQSYNYGWGFALWLNKNGRGGKYTKELAYQFSLEQVKKYGKISRVPPGYGDSQYAQRILKENFNGKLPQIGKCEDNSGGATAGTASSCPKNKIVAQNRPKSVQELMPVSRMNLGANGIRFVNVGGQPFLRAGTVTALQKIGRAYKAKYGKHMVVTSMYRPGQGYWHTTGWAVDIDVPDARCNSSKTFCSYSNRKHHEEAKFIILEAIKAGFGEILFGENNVVNEVNKMYGKRMVIFEGKLHFNHIHLSYPVCKR